VLFMPLDDKASAGMKARRRLVALGLILGALGALSPAFAQAPTDPAVERQKQLEQKKKQQQQQQQQQQGHPPPKSGNAPQVTPKSVQPDVRRLPPQQQQSAPSFQRRPDGGPPTGRAGPQGDFRRADPQGQPPRQGQPTFAPPKLPPASAQGAPPKPAGPPTDANVQGGAKRFLPPSPPLPPSGRPATATSKDATQPPLPDHLRRPPGAPPFARPPLQGGPVAPGLPKAAGPGGGPLHIDQVRKERVRTVGPGGQTVIQEPGNRTIVKQGNRVFVTRNETTVIQNFAPGARTSKRPDGVSETVYARPDGSRVFTEVDANGRLMRRYRRDAGGREIVLVDNRRFLRNVAIGVGAAAIATAVIVSLPRPAIALPHEKYVVEYVNASDDDLYECLTAPPVEQLERDYSLDEIRYSVSLRDRVRRIDLDNINFETGSFEVTPDQYGTLERIARAMGRAIEANPAEVFLIEGHTDAVGTDEDNLSLSDRRAESVAHILVEHFNIPPENLVTQGYGEQFLKVDTQAPERLNRRVAVRRITPLLSQH
jgi:outer membrane protein OmpA-like peptidoglycan-associated protein